MLLSGFMPDAIKAAFKNKKLAIRNPNSVRPWQHVLEPLSGYLLLGQHLHQNNLLAAESWNFGPASDSNLDVNSLVKLMGQEWEKISWEINRIPGTEYESKTLMVDSSKANSLIGWKPVWDLKKTVKYTVEWYRKYLEENKVITDEQIMNYITEAKTNNFTWAT